jgi:hypothetical protein
MEILKPSLIEILTGSLHFAWNHPAIWGPQIAYYDGWHYCMHFGLFSIEVFI